MAEYLAIDGWDEFQKYRGRRASFILDATDQWEKPKLSGLSHFVRSVLQELRRARGRTGKNIPYDLTHIASATHTIGTDRPHLQHAILTLISRGLLVVTDQQVDLLNPGEIENKKEINKDNKPYRTAKPPSDPRFRLFVDVLNRYHGRFVGEKLRFNLWFGRRGGKQLNNLLKAEPDLDVKTFEQAVAVRARSPSVKHEQAVFEWLFHVLSGPKGAVNGNANKAQQRERERDRKWDAIAGGGASHALPEGSGIGLRPGLERGENRAMAGPAENEAKILPPGDH